MKPPRRAATLAGGLLLLAAVPSAARAAQSTASYAEWQFSGGQLLERHESPDVPTWSVQLGAGLSSAPKFEGDSNVSLEPDPLAEVHYKDLLFASLGDGIGVNLVRSKVFRAGVSLTADLGRSQHDGSGLEGLGGIDAAPEIKLFAEGLLYPVTVRLDVRRALGGTNGIVGDLGAYVPILATKNAYALVGPTVSFADPQYMRRYFGVDANQSAHSGLPRHHSDGGFKSAGLGLTAGWEFTEHWFVESLVGAEYLLSEAADSPVVRDRNGVVVSVFVGYDF